LEDSLLFGPLFEPYKSFVVLVPSPAAGLLVPVPGSWVHHNGNAPWSGPTQHCCVLNFPLIALMYLPFIPKGLITFPGIAQYLPFIPKGLITFPGIAHGTSLFLHIVACVALVLESIGRQSIDLGFECNHLMVFPAGLGRLPFIVLDQFVTLFFSTTWHEFHRIGDVASGLLSLKELNMVFDQFIVESPEHIELGLQWDIYLRRCESMQPHSKPGVSSGIFVGIGGVESVWLEVEVEVEREELGLYVEDSWLLG
jgi:hypothetical protein